MSTLQPIGQDMFFNLTIDEVRLLNKYRTLATHQKRGIQQAIEILEPSTGAQLPRPKRPVPAEVEALEV